MPIKYYDTIKRCEKVIYIIMWKDLQEVASENTQLQHNILDPSFVNIKLYVYVK